MNFDLNNQRDVDQLLRVAIKAAIKAGEEILDVYDSTIEVEMKEDNTPLTEADKRSHKVIADILGSYGLPVLSEEGKDIPYNERAAWDWFWMVDPLDGTKEFIKRNGEFTVNIALINEKKVFLGIIFAPVQGILYFGAPEWKSRKTTILKDGNGNFILPEIKRSEILPFRNSEKPYTVVCSRSHMSVETEAFVGKVKIAQPDLEYASRGSSLKLCLIAEGLADIYPRLAPTMEWDTAAGQAIVEYSGGFVLRADNLEAMAYNKEDLLNPWFISGRDKNDIPRE